MAYVDSSAGPTDPTQQQNPNQTANPTTGLNPALNQAPQTASATSSNSTAGSGAQGAAATPTASSAAPVQNLTSYLSANAPQAQQLGQNISTGLTNQYNQVQGDINNASTQFNNQVQSASTPYNAQLVSGAVANPSQFVSDPDNVSQFQGQLNAKYTGPTDFTQQAGYGNLQSEVQNAVTNAGNAASQQGLGTLVNSVENNPTPGQSTLDAMILGGNPTAWAQVQQAAAPFSSLNSYLGSQTATNNAAATNALNTDQDTANQAQQALTGAANNFDTSINQEVKNAQQGLTDYGTNMNNYVQAIQKGGLGGLSVAQQHQLGVDPALTQILTGLPTVQNEMTSQWQGLPTLSIPSLQDAFTVPQVPTGVPTAQNVASSSDYAKALALDQLAGGNTLGLPLDATTQSQAGSFQVPNALPSINGQKAGQELWNALQPWAKPAGVTPATAAPGAAPVNSTVATADYASLMNTLAQYLGLPAFNPAYPTTTQPSTPPSGGPSNGPPGGDVHQ